jgi:hypothetical protein
MKIRNTIISITVAALVFGATNAFALSAYTKIWEFFPMETTDWNLVEGKSKDDYHDIQKKFAEHLKNLGAADSETLYTEPYYYGEKPKYSFLYVNYWKNGADLGDYTKKWTGSWQVNPTKAGLGIVVPYGGIVDHGGGPHVLWSAAMVREPKTKKITKESMLVLQRCTFKTKPTTMAELREAVDAMVAEMDKWKYMNGVWIMFPAWGDVGPDLDFQILTRYDSAVELGEAWEIYAPGTEAHTAIEAATGAVFSSVVTRVDFPTVLKYMSEKK